MSDGFSTKRLSPAAINALKDALSTIYWYKRDLRSFLTHCLSDPILLSRLDWDDYKHNIVGQMVDYLARNENAYQDQLIRLMAEVVKVKDFSHLAYLEDGAQKVKRAESSVAALKQHLKGHHELFEKDHEAEKAREGIQQEKVKTNAVKTALGDMTKEYVNLISSDDPQGRGYRLEKILHGLFKLFDLDPKASFRTVGEQIDGAFTFEGFDYLLEAKWQGQLINASNLDSLSGKLTRRLDNTLGLYLSVNGFSPDAVTIHSAGRSTIILMDGSDLMAVLENRIDLPLMLRRKRRSAAQTGNIYLKVQEILYGKNEL